MNISIGDTVRLYDTNDIKKLYIVGMDTEENYEYLCIDTMTHEVVLRLTENDIINKKFKIVKDKNFYLKEELIKCISKIKVKYPHDRIYFSSYDRSSCYLEVYRSYGDCTHVELTVDDINDNDREVIKSIEKFYELD